MKLKEKTYINKQFAIHANHIFCCCDATLSLYKKYIRWLNFPYVKLLYILFLFSLIELLLV